jgi:hypothetical protein
MTALTRRQDIDVQYESWHVYYGDVRVGTIAKRIGIPPGEDPWGWACGFYPGCHPKERTHGTAATSTRRALSSRKHGASSCQTGLKLIFRNGARNGPSLRGNIECGTPATGCRRSPRMAGQRAFAAPP